MPKQKHNTKYRAKKISDSFSGPGLISLDRNYPYGVVYDTMQVGPATNGKVFQEMPGLITYEYTNHLGNVLLTTSDKKLPINNMVVRNQFIAGTSTDGWVPNYGGLGVTVATDDPNDRLQVSTSLQNRGAFRNFATEPGRVYLVTLDIDPYTSAEILYGANDNGPGTPNIVHGVSTTPTVASFTFTALSSSSSIMVTNHDNSGNPVTFFVNEATVREIGFNADVASTVDYYPYGMPMVGRAHNQDDYRFGYQGSEMDNEHKSNGNAYTTYFRQHDPRLGRWFSVDPVTQPWQSPYNSMNGNPIALNDIMGDAPGLGTKIANIFRSKGNKKHHSVAKGQGFGKRNKGSSDSPKGNGGGLKLNLNLNMGNKLDMSSLTNLNFPSLDIGKLGSLSLNFDLNLNFKFSNPEELFQPVKLGGKDEYKKILDAYRYSYNYGLGKLPEREKARWTEDNPLRYEDLFDLSSFKGWESRGWSLMFKGFAEPGSSSKSAEFFLSGKYAGSTKISHVYFYSSPIKKAPFDYNLTLYGGNDLTGGNSRLGNLSFKNYHQAMKAYQYVQRPIR